MNLFQARKPRRPPIMGDPCLERWENRPEHRALNNGMGACNLGAGRPGMCIFGGIGCNVDHAWIGYHREAEER